MRSRRQRLLTRPKAPHGIGVVAAMAETGLRGELLQAARCAGLLPAAGRHAGSARIPMRERMAPCVPRGAEKKGPEDSATGLRLNSLREQAFSLREIRMTEAPSRAAHRTVAKPIPRAGALMTDDGDNGASYLRAQACRRGPDWESGLLVERIRIRTPEATGRW